MSRIGVTLGLVVASTVIGLMGTDLVLPAVPTLPEALGGTVATAQLVLAAYVTGSAIGMLGFGKFSDRIDTGPLFVGSLIATAVLSFLCSRASSIEWLMVLRIAQGASASGPAVLAPGLVRALLNEARAVRVMGLLGSIESLAPALAPIAGAALLAWGSWRTSFDLLFIVAGLLALALLARGPLPQIDRRPGGSYARLLGDRIFIRYALSQACVLGGLLIFVFGMPTMFVRVLGGSLSDFVIMQTCGIATFIVAANLSGQAVARFGVERVISFGTALAAGGAAAQLAYALVGGTHPLIITACFVPVNLGLGVRGPAGFYRAIIASQGDDARGSALVMLGVFAVAATGTAVSAQWIERGMVPLAAVACAVQTAAVLTLALLPRLREDRR